MSKYPALKTAIIVSLGIVLGRYLDFSIPVAMILLTVLLIILIYCFLLKKNHMLTLILVISGLLLIGLTRYEQSTRLFPCNHIIHFCNRNNNYKIKGYLFKDPVKRQNRTDLYMRVESIRLIDSTLSVKGNILATIYGIETPRLRYGDEIYISGILKRPAVARNPGGFDYRTYLARQNIHAVVKIYDIGQITITKSHRGNPFIRKIIYPVRRFIIDVINKTTSEENRPLLRALIVGDRGMISPEVRDLFSKAGAIHVLAVSGLHVGFVIIILSFISGLFRIPRPFKAVITAAGLIFYVFITEAKPPVVRASFMACIYLAGSTIERRSNSFNIIGVAALVMLLINPQNLFDAGFQLSFTAVISIIYFYNKTESFKWIKELQITASKNLFLKYLLTLLLVSLSAQIGTIPLTATYFNRIPLLSILVNLAAIPLAGVIIALGFTSIISACISSWISSVYGVLNDVIISIFRKTVSIVGNLPVSHITIPTPGLVNIIIYFLILLLIFNFNSCVLRRRFALLCLLGLNILIWKNVIWNNSSKLTWVQFDVGQGDAALLRLPRNRYILIDGGNKSSYFDSGKSTIAPYLYKNGIRRLNSVILTHPHNDHAGGLIHIVQNFRVDTFITAGTVFNSEIYSQLLKEIEERKIPLRIVTSPDSLIGFPGIRIYILSPDSIQKIKSGNGDSDVNNQSIVARVLFGNIRILFTGDAEKEIEKKLIDSGVCLKSQAIKVGHHGSSTSSTYSFIRRVSPEFAVISVGKNNKYNHPSKIVIQKYIDTCSKLFRTDRDGAVILTSDGKKLRMVNWRKVYH